MKGFSPAGLLGLEWTVGALLRQKPSSRSSFERPSERCLLPGAGGSPPVGSLPSLAVGWLLAALAPGIAFSAGHLLELGTAETLQERVRSLVPVVCVSGSPYAQRDDEAPQPGRAQTAVSAQRRERKALASCASCQVLAQAAPPPVGRLFLCVHPEVSALRKGRVLVKALSFDSTKAPASSGHERAFLLPVPCAPCGTLSQLMSTGRVNNSISKC